MGRRTKLFFTAGLVVLAFTFLHSVNAEAARGQKYFGDGAVPNPAGGWLYNVTDSSCLRCHNPGFDPGLDKTSYLMTGHKNVLRKATLNVTRTGPDGLPYDTDFTGHAIFWNVLGPVSLGTSTTFPPKLDGVCSFAGYATPADCQAAGGTWTIFNNSLFYIYGGWMNEAAAGAYNNALTSIAAPGSVYDNGSYSCARCHTTGVTLDTQVSTTRQPEKTYPGINGYVAFDPDGDGPATTVSWATGSTTGQALDGVQCERCHDATRHFSPLNQPATSYWGASATTLCVQCHRQEHTESYISGGLGININPTPVSDNTVTLAASEPKYPVPEIEVGSSSGYAPQFYGYSTGMEFLNSAHGKYTGNFQQTNNAAMYNSFFVSAFTAPVCQASNGRPVPDYADQATCEGDGFIWAAGKGGSCTTCHDVHQSTVPTVIGAVPFKNECTTCHVDQVASYPMLSAIAMVYHPTGTGTPREKEATSSSSPCVICHMPRPNSGQGLSMHIWRINMDTSYSTFPTQTAWNEGQKTAYIATDGTYTNAVWVDLDLVCGQCHGENGSAKHLLSKTVLASYAAVMHNGGSVPATDCATCHATPQNGNAAIVGSGPGQNHHDPAVISCETCHASAAYGTRPGSLATTTNGATKMTDNGFCKNCHSVTPGTDHHDGTCINCHIPGVAAIVDCTICHTMYLNHPGQANAALGATQKDRCLKCHSSSAVVSGVSSTNYPGVFPTSIQAACGQCHGGALEAKGAPYQDLADLAVPFSDIHGLRARPGFSAVNDTSISYKVNFDASSSTNAKTYNWTFGDGGVATGATVSHLYSNSSNTYSVTLMLNQGAVTQNTMIKTITPRPVNHPPTVSGLAAAYLSTSLAPAIVNNAGNTVTFTDGSSDPDNNIASVMVNWGDGTVSPPQATSGGTFTHNYTRAGKFTITHVVMDGAYQRTLEKAYVKIVPMTYAISGSVVSGVTSSSISGAIVYLKLNSHTRAITRSQENGTYAFPGVRPGTYTVHTIRKNYTFVDTIVTVSTSAITGNTITATN